MAKTQIRKNYVIRMPNGTVVHRGKSRYAAERVLRKFKRMDPDAFTNRIVQIEIAKVKRVSKFEREYITLPTDAPYTITNDWLSKTGPQKTHSQDKDDDYE